MRRLVQTAAAGIAAVEPVVTIVLHITRIGREMSNACLFLQKLIVRSLQTAQELEKEDEGDDGEAGEEEGEEGGDVEGWAEEAGVEGVPVPEHL